MTRCSDAPGLRVLRVSDVVGRDLGRCPRDDTRVTWAPAPGPPGAVALRCARGCREGLRVVVLRALGRLSALPDASDRSRFERVCAEHRTPLAWRGDVALCNATDPPHEARAWLVLDRVTGEPTRYAGTHETVAVLDQAAPADAPLDLQLGVERPRALGHDRAPARARRS